MGITAFAHTEKFQITLSTRKCLQSEHQLLTRSDRSLSEFQLQLTCLGLQHLEAVARRAHDVPQKKLVWQPINTQ